MGEKCWMCEINEIEMKRRPLCHSCYKTCREKDMLFMFSLQDIKERTCKFVTNKYGKDFLNDMNSLKDVNITLEMIGDKYNVSRELIRQLYPKIYGIPYTEIVKDNKEERSIKILTERKAKLHIESKIKRYKKDGNCYKGIVGEYIFYKKCLELKFNISPRCFGKHIYDADVNGFKVEIKSVTKTAPKPHKQNQEYYHLSPKKKQIEVCDFFAIYISCENFWYILPKHIVKSEGLFIPKYEQYGNGKYQELQQYREAWHLLDKINK